MKAIQITQPFGLDVISLPEPALGEGEVRLRIRYVGFCGSDLNTWRGGNAMAKAGVIPGHEVGAEIAAVGPGVPDTLRPGMTVTVNPYTACGHCAACRNGRSNACEFNETLGVQRDGAMREYFVVPWEKVIVTEGLSARDCALVEPLSVGFHAVNRAQVKEKDVVAVFGCGMIGLGAIIGAARRGATVVAMDIDDEKLKVAEAVGAKFTVNTAYEDVQEGISEMTNGLLADVVIEAVGSPVTQRQAIANVGFTGRAVFIGYAKDQTTFRTTDFVKKELNLMGSRNAQPEDFRAVIDYLRLGTCPYDKLITRVVPPEEAAEAMRHWHENPGKVFRILVGF
jgi:threonine dehydrogenase-like Zn-dependent dehydrogenase